MAHFAEIDSENEVIRVLVVPDSEEHRGQEFLADDLGLGGFWVQTSYNGNIRANFAGIGCFYDETNDVFLFPKPFDNWVLNDVWLWVPPVAKPDGVNWEWDQENTEWVAISSDDYRFVSND